jgi:signal transduction histidine kinase/ligand-binding sensor domain-containing protein/CheY-like chemotaxis protein/AraC-like DNA-binding protein
MNESGSRIFIGTKNGLDILDRSTNRIDRMKFADLDKDEIRSIVVDNQGYIWVGTYIRLVRLSPDLQHCKRYDSKGLPVTSVNSIYKDNKGDIWAMFWEKGLYKYRPSIDRFEKMPKVGNLDNPFRLFQDRQGRYWLTTWADGIFSMHRPSDRTVSYKSMNITGLKDKATSNFYSIIQDEKNGYIWMVGASGLVIARPEKDSLIVMNSMDLSAKMNYILNDVFNDRSGNIWLTSSNGVYYIDLYSASIYNFSFASLMSEYNVAPLFTAFYIDYDGDIWLSQKRSGFGFCSSSGRMTLYQDIPALSGHVDLFDIASINHFSLMPDYVWVLPQFNSCAYVMTKSGGMPSIIKTFDFNKIHGGFPTYFFEDNAHNIWISTTKGLLAKPLGADFQNVNIPLNDISSIAEDSDGNIWLATISKGLFYAKPYMLNGRIHYDKPANITQTNSKLPTNHIETICYDDCHQQMWIGTDEGAVIIYDIRKRTFEDAPIHLNNYMNGKIQNIIKDCYGNIWIKTSKAVLKYDVKDKSCIKYNADDGITVQAYSQNAFCYRGTDDIYFGGYGGIVRFNVNSLVHNTKTVSRPIISDIKINNESILDSAYKEPNKLSIKERKVTLGSDAENIEIDFTSCEYGYPKKIIYAYKLHGVDRDWVYTNGERNYAFYNKLSKGSHILQIRATDANGRWSGDTVCYTIEQLPAFYETTFAYILYFLAIVTMTVLTYCSIHRRIILRQRMHILKIEKDKEEELTRTKLKYFTNVSHNFLTPITIISCIIDQMSMNSSSEASNFRRIRANLKNLKELIQQVLDFRKMEHGDMKIEVAKGDLVSYIRKACNDYFEPLMQRKSLDFCFDTEQETLPAYFDANKMDKILMNLLSNAYKYTDKGGIRVVLSSIEDGKHRYAIIQVADTGKGISEEDQKRIFDPFYTVEKSRNDSNGIGLSLVKDLVRLHHATMKTDSAPDKGTTFTICLPIDAESYADNEFAANPEEQNIGKLEDEMTILEDRHEHDSTLKNCDDNTLLIVEDNEELLELMSKIFSNYHHVLNAHNGIEAIQVIERNEPDIIISDVMMPEMDGLELCHHLKSDIKTSHIPIILLTARTTPEDRVACYDAGTDGYIAKPFELKVLKARIDNFLKMKHEKQREFRKGGMQNADELGISDMDKKFIKDAVALIESNIDNDGLDVNFIAGKLLVSNSSLYRKIKSISGMSPVEFIRSIRLKHAYELLMQGNKTITEIAYECGFSTSRYFSTCFKAEFGVTPTEIKIEKD